MLLVATVAIIATVATATVATVAIATAPATVATCSRSDNGPEFITKAVRQWLSQMGVKTLYIEPGSPWENRYNESFNGKLLGELLNRVIFYTLQEA